MKIDIWTAAADDKGGTRSAAFASESEAYNWVLEQIGEDREAFEASDTDCIWEFIQSNSDCVATYNVELGSVVLPHMPIMGAAIRDELSAAIDEAQTEFEGKIKAYNDYTPAELDAQRQRFKDARTWLDLARGAPAMLAAAPQMLEALKEIVANNYGQPRGVSVPSLDAARAAIAAAESTPTVDINADTPIGEIEQKKRYTVFCQQADGTGTIWIDAFDAVSVEDAKEQAIAQCSFDWEFDRENIAVLGVAEGDSTIIEWTDLGVD